VAKIIILLKKKSQATWSMELFGKFSQKNCHILRKKGYEIAKIFGGFGQISSFLLLKISYLTNKF